MTNIKNKLENSIFWLSGDFNLPYINWPNQSVTCTMYPREFNGLFIDMINKLGIDQMWTFPQERIIFLIFFCTNQPSLLSKVKSMPGI